MSEKTKIMYSVKIKRCEDDPFRGYIIGGKKRHDEIDKEIICYFYGGSFRCLAVGMRGRKNRKERKQQPGDGAEQ